MSNDKLREALAIVEKYGMKGDVIYKEIEALSASKQEPQRCKTCDGTGDIHRIDGEYLGECPHCKPEPVGINGLTYAEESATASVLGIVNSKPEPQAQAGEPEVVGWYDPTNRSPGQSVTFEKDVHDKFPHLFPVPFITLQSHREAMEAQRKAIKFEAWEYRERIVPELREAIAKKDAALDACVEALESYSKSPYVKKQHPKRHAAGNAAISQAKDARK